MMKTKEVKSEFYFLYNPRKDCVYTAFDKITKLDALWVPFKTLKQAKKNTTNTNYKIAKICSIATITFLDNENE